VIDACIQEVSVRECLKRLTTPLKKRDNSKASFISVPSERKDSMRKPEDEQSSVSRMLRIGQVRFERGTLETGS
jgi:hypothetical protein